MSEPYGGLPDRLTDAGMAFNYVHWTPRSVVSFHTVSWTADYRDIVEFESDDALHDYLREHMGGTNYEVVSYAKADEPIRIGLPFNYVNRFNYVRVYNRAMPVDKDIPAFFYYFIRDVKFIAPETTEITLQLDVWQTYGRRVEFGQCYVERGHLGIANENQMRDYGREFLAVPEGLDIGNEYYIEDVYEHKIADNKAGTDYHILVWSVTNITADPGTLEKPSLAVAEGTRMEGLPNGANVYWFTSLQDFLTMKYGIAQSPWVAQGIISIMVVPPLELEPGQYTERVVSTPAVPNVRKYRVREIGEIAAYTAPKIITLASGWRDRCRIPSRYSRLKKFLTFPYTTVELTTYSGTPLILKPEAMGHNDLRVVRLSSFILPSPRLMFYPYRYNAAPGVAGNDGVIQSRDSHDGAEFMDMMTGIVNFPTFTIANDGYRMYMASNAHTIAYQHQAADWSQQRALTANQLGYDQATNNMNLAGLLNTYGVLANSQNLAVNLDTATNRGILQALQGGASGAGMGGVGGGLGAAAGALAGALGSAANTAIGMNQMSQQTAIQNSLMNNQTSANMRSMGFLRDTNKDFADFAARGDYAMQIGAINAKVQDAKLAQPTTVGQVGGDAFNLVAFKWALHAKVKRISPSAMAIVGEYWLRYGYAVNRFYWMKNLSVMERFTYWKLRETYLLSGRMPEPFRQTIRGIFEKGVTVWRDPRLVGRVDISDNAPLPGVRL